MLIIKYVLSWINYLVGTRYVIQKIYNDNLLRIMKKKIARIRIFILN